MPSESSEDRRLYLDGWAYAEDPASIAERADMSRSVAMSVAGRHALVSAGVDARRDRCVRPVLLLSRRRCGWAVTHWDSQSTIRAGSRSRVGCPYAGGPASGYMTHAIASAFDSLGHAPGRTLVTGVGMHMAKHVAAVWSSTPGAAAGTPDPDCAPGRGGRRSAAPPRFSPPGPGPATVCAYTVAHGRDGAPEQGLVVLDTEDGRALARVYDADLLADAESTRTRRAVRDGDHGRHAQRSTLVKHSPRRRRPIACRVRARSARC